MYSVHHNDFAQPQSSSICIASIPGRQEKGAFLFALEANYANETLLYYTHAYHATLDQWYFAVMLHVVMHVASLPHWPTTLTPPPPVI